MARNLALLPMLFSLTFLACQQPGQSAGPLSGGDIESLEALIDSHVQAGLEGDWDSFFGHYTTDAVMMFSNRPALEGLEAIRAVEWYRAVKYDVTPIEIEGRGDLAYIRGRRTLLIDLDGATEDRGKFLWVARRQPGGAWMFSIMIANSDLPPS